VAYCSKVNYVANTLVFGPYSAYLILDSVDKKYFFKCVVTIIGLFGLYYKKFKGLSIKYTPKVIFYQRSNKMVLVNSQNHAGMT